MMRKFGHQIDKWLAASGSDSDSKLTYTISHLEHELFTDDHNLSNKAAANSRNYGAIPKLLALFTIK
jgi:hypothetical protein